MSTLIPTALVTRCARAGHIGGSGGEHGRRGEDGNSGARLEGVDHGETPGVVVEGRLPDVSVHIP